MAAVVPAGMPVTARPGLVIVMMDGLRRLNPVNGRTVVPAVIARLGGPGRDRNQKRRKEKKGDEFFHDLPPL